jgi:hypothetical protein
MRNGSGGHLEQRHSLAYSIKIRVMHWTTEKDHWLVSLYTYRYAQGKVTQIRNF